MTNSSEQKPTTQPQQTQGDKSQTPNPQQNQGDNKPSTEKPAQQK
jgi:hypothetical protein